MHADIRKRLTEFVRRVFNSISKYKNFFQRLAILSKHTMKEGQGRPRLKTIPFFVTFKTILVDFNCSVSGQEIFYTTAR